MSTVDSTNVIIGSSATPDNNFKFLIDDLGGMTLKSGGGTNTVLSIDSAGVITFPNTVQLGVGQTWQSFSIGVNRSAATTYTNSTGRPIEVIISGGSAVDFTVSGVVVASQQSTRCVVSAVIPNGATYSIAVTGSLVYWAELR